MLIGHVGKEPDIKYYDADQCVASFSLATTEKGYRLPNGTEVPTRTDWHNLVLFKGLAKYAEQYIHKGDKLYIEGRMRYVTVEDKAGRRSVHSEIHVENLEWLAASRKPVVETKTESGADNDDSKLPF